MIPLYPNICYKNHHVHQSRATKITKSASCTKFARPWPGDCAFGAPAWAINNHRSGKKMAIILIGSDVHQQTWGYSIFEYYLVKFGRCKLLQLIRNGGNSNDTPDQTWHHQKNMRFINYKYHKSVSSSLFSNISICDSAKAQAVEPEYSWIERSTWSPMASNLVAVSMETPSSC